MTLQARVDMGMIGCAGRCMQAHTPASDDGAGNAACTAESLFGANKNVATGQT